MIRLKKKLKQIILKYYIQFFLPKPKLGDTILITSTDGIGDNVVRLRILEEILAVFGKETCYILAEEKVKPLLEKIGFEHIIVFDKKKRSKLKGKIELWKELLSRSWKEVISLEFDQHDFDIQFLEGIPNIGFENLFHPEMNPYYDRLVSIREGKVENRVFDFFEEYFQKQLSEKEIIPKLEKYYTEQKTLPNNMAVGIGAGARYKILAPSVLAETLKLFYDKKMLTSISLLGFGEKEQFYVEELKKYISFSDFGIQSQVGFLSFEESIKIIQQSQCYLGMDSGLFHIAAALGKETYGIFTEEHPFSHETWENVTIFYGQEGRNDKEDYYGNPKLNAINVREIEKKIK